MKKLWHAFIAWQPSTKLASIIIISSTVIIITGIVILLMSVRASSPEENNSTNQNSAGQFNQEANEGDKVAPLRGFISDVQTDSAKLYTETELGSNNSVEYQCSLDDSSEIIQSGVAEVPFTQIKGLPEQANILCIVGTSEEKLELRFDTLATFNPSKDVLNDLSVVVAGRPNHILRATWSVSDGNIEPTKVRYAILDNEDRYISLGQSDYLDGELTRVIPKELLENPTYKILVWRDLQDGSSAEVELQEFNLTRDEIEWVIEGNVSSEDTVSTSASLPKYSMDESLSPIGFERDTDNILLSKGLNAGVFTSDQGSESSRWAWLNTKEITDLTLTQDVWKEFKFIAAGEINNNTLNIGAISKIENLNNLWNIVSPKYEWVNDDTLSLSWRTSPERNTGYDWGNFTDTTFIITIDNLLTGQKVTRAADDQTSLDISGLNSMSIYSINISFATMNPNNRIAVKPLEFIVSNANIAFDSDSIGYSATGGKGEVTISWDNEYDSVGLGYAIEVKETLDSPAKVYIIDNPQKGINSLTIDNLEEEQVYLRILSIIDGGVASEEPFTKLTLGEEVSRILGIDNLNISRVSAREIEVSWTEGLGDSTTEVLYDLQQMQDSRWVSVLTSSTSISEKIIVKEDNSSVKLRARARSESYLSEFISYDCFIDNNFFCEKQQ
jgi:hypothetical protein